MPSLKQISCSIELGGTNTKLTEYGTKYGDGHVTSYVAVPVEEVNFSMHLASNGYIAPGLAMFVYIDGHYQANRNRRGLVLPGSRVSPEQYQVDLRIRQKESKQPDGSFLGRDWTFHKLNLVSADKVEETSETFLDNMGTIEIVVLRCKDAPPPPPVSAPRQTHTSHASSTTKVASTPANDPPSKPLSHQAKAPAVKEPSVKNKALSKVKSSKKESEIGGLFGLFDGASDEPDGLRAKPYWDNWNKRPVDGAREPSKRAPMYIAPEEPLPQVPASAAKKHNVEHQVKTGKGAQYLHLCARPEYLDDMKHPYAVFTFKYRSKKVIERMFKIKIKEEGKDLKAKLADMSKDELAEELFRLRMAGRSSKTTKTAKVDDKTPSAARASKHSTPKSDKAETPRDQVPTQGGAQVNTTWPAQDNTGWNNEPAQQNWNNEPAQQNTNWDQPPVEPTSAWDQQPVDTIPVWEDTTKPASKAASKPPTKVSPKAATAPAAVAAPVEPTPNKPSSKAASKTASQKAASKPPMPCSYPSTNVAKPKSHSSKQAEGGAANQPKAPSSKKSEKKDENAGGAADWDKPAAAAGDWDKAAEATPANGTWQDNTGGAPQAGAWDNWHTVITVIGTIAVVSLVAFVYYWIRGWVLEAIAYYMLFRSYATGAFAWVGALWMKVPGRDVFRMDLSGPRCLSAEFWMQARFPLWFAWPEMLESPEMPGFWQDFCSWLSRFPDMWSALVPGSNVEDVLQET